MLVYILGYFIITLYNVCVHIRLFHHNFVNVCVYTRLFHILFSTDINQPTNFGKNIVKVMSSVHKEL